MGRIAFNPISKNVSVGGRDFTVSALPLGVVRYKLWPLSESMASGEKTLDGVLDDMINHVLASLSASEPDLTKDDILDGLLLSDISALFREVCQVSGMRRADAETQMGEGTSPGSFGPASTGSSSPALDGASTTSTDL